MDKKSLFMAGLFIFLFSGCGDKNKGAADDKEIKTQELTQVTQAETKDSFPEPQPEPQIPNPFLTSEEKEYFEDTRKETRIDYLNLTAVFYSPLNSKAIIEGRIYKVGDIVDNKKIVEINPEEVMLEDSQGAYVIALKPVLEK